VTDIRRDLARNTLAILCILGLIGLSLWVLRPFLAAAVWAAMIVVATWPLFLSLEARLGNRRGPAVAIMTLAMLLAVDRSIPVVGRQRFAATTGLGKSAATARRTAGCRLGATGCGG
jgi:hypothetical protein